MLSILVMSMALHSASTWAVRDTTDNNTGKREVSVLQLSENDVASNESAALSMVCLDGEVRMWLMWPNALGSGFLPVAVDWGVGPWSKSLGRPASWEISPTSDNTFAEAPAGDAKRIVEAIPDGTPFRLTVYRSSGAVTATFLSEGLKSAYSRISAHCPNEN